MKSWKTTLCGVLGIVGAAITQFFPEYPLVFKVGGFMAAIGPALGLLFARDNNVTSEQAGATAPRSGISTPLLALAAALGLSALMVGCASYKVVGTVTVTAERAMTSWATYYDAAHANPAAYGATVTELEKRRVQIDRAWESYRLAANTFDDVRQTGGDTKAALLAVQSRSTELVNLVLSFLPEKFQPK